MFNINRKIKYKKGLTMIELMVVIGIFMMISGVALFNYGNFSSNISLQNLTDDIALSIRKAQGFAIGARGVGTDFRNSYGIHFSVNSIEPTSLESSSKSFLMFSVPADVTLSEKKYIVGAGSCGESSNKCVEYFNIMTSDYIKEISVSIDDVMTPITSNAFIDIVFTRPNPRAYICYRQTISSICASVPRVEITISNGRYDDNGQEKTKIISVQNTGQISIQ